MGKRLQELRNGLTPRRGLWTGISLFAVVGLGTMLALEIDLSFLIAPAATFFTSTVLPASN